MATFTFPSGREVTIEPIVRGAMRPISRKRQGWGDYTESLLKKIGITEDRVKDAKAAIGLAPKCACAARKAWLNKASDWWRGETTQSPNQ